MHRDRSEAFTAGLAAASQVIKDAMKTDVNATKRDSVQTPTQATHAATPGPWRISTLFPDGNDCVVESVNGRMVCECFEDGEEQADEDRANAAFVVRACNSHAELLAALKECVRVAIYKTESDVQMDAIERAEAAIANATRAA